MGRETHVGQVSRGSSSRPSPRRGLGHARSSRLAKAILAAAVAVAAAGCGDESSGDDELRERAASFDRAAGERANKIRAWVEEGRLPPVALELIGPDDEIRFGFVGGPDGDEDVVRSSPDGRSGPPLRWDLDGDGKKETDITERELYDATLGS